MALSTTVQMQLALLNEYKTHEHPRYTHLTHPFCIQYPTDKHTEHLLTGRSLTTPYYSRVHIAGSLTASPCYSLLYNPTHFRLEKRHTIDSEPSESNRQFTPCLLAVVASFVPVE